MNMWTRIEGQHNAWGCELQQELGLVDSCRVSEVACDDSLIRVSFNHATACPGDRAIFFKAAAESHEAQI